MILSIAQQLSEDQMDPYKLLPGFCLVQWYKKKKAKFFSSLGTLPFFSKICVFNNVSGPKKRSYKLDSNCQVSLWTIVNLSLRFVLIHNMTKVGQIIFFHWKCWIFFSKNCVFNNFLGPKNAPITSRVIVRIACGSLKRVPWGLSHSIIPGKKGQKHLSLWKQQFFEMFLYIDRLGPE